MAEINNRLEVLLRWVNTFSLPERVSSTKDLKDGVIILKILKYLAPNYFIYPLWGVGPSAKNMHKRFEHIMIGLSHFCTTEFVYREHLTADWPSHALVEGRAEDWVLFLELVLLTSTRSARKKECIRRMRVMKKLDLEVLVEVMREAMHKYCLSSTKYSESGDSSTYLSFKNTQLALETNQLKTSEDIVKWKENQERKKKELLQERHEYLKALLIMMEKNDAENENDNSLIDARRKAQESDERTTTLGNSTWGSTETSSVTAWDKEDYIHKFEVLHSQAAALRYSLTASALKFDLLSQIGGPESSIKSPFEDLSEEMAGLAEELSRKKLVIKQLESKLSETQDQALSWQKRFKKLKCNENIKIEKSTSWQTEQENDEAGNIAKTWSEIEEDVSRLQLEAFKVEIEDAQKRLELEKLGSQIQAFGDTKKNLDSIFELEEVNDVVSTVQHRDMSDISKFELESLRKELSSYQKEREALKKKLDETRCNVKMLEDFVRYTREENVPSKQQSEGKVSEELKVKIAGLKEELTATIAQTTNNKIMEAFNQQKKFLDLITKNLNNTSEPIKKGEHLKKHHEELKELLVSIEKSADKGKAEVLLGQCPLENS